MGLYLANYVHLFRCFHLALNDKRAILRVMSERTFEWFIGFDLPGAYTPRSHGLPPPAATPSPVRRVADFGQ